MTSTASLAAKLLKDDLPDSFRVLAYGENTNTNGPPLVLTPENARAIVARANARTADVLIDLQHRSLDARASADATDAMGYGRLALRADGIYMVNVTWTPEGARRLRAKSQRYISPVAAHEDFVVCDILNCGLVAEPALDQTPALVAASRKPAAAPRAQVLSTKVPAELRLAFVELALERGMTPAALLRKMVERAPWLEHANDKREVIATLTKTPADLKRLCDLLDISPTSTPDVIRAAIEDFLAELPEDSPAAVPIVPDDPTAAAADPPQPNPDEPPAKTHRYSPAVQAAIAKMDPVQRARFDQMQRASMLRRGRAVRKAPKGPLSPAIASKVAAMSPQQKAKFWKLREER